MPTTLANDVMAGN